MKNETASRQAAYAIASLACYIVSCYIAFSEPWPAGAMKIFMAIIAASAFLFVYFSGRLSAVPAKSQAADFVPACSAAK